MRKFLLAVRFAVNEKYLLVWCNRAKHFTHLYKIDKEECEQDELIFDFRNTKFKRKSVFEWTFTK